MWVHKRLVILIWWEYHVDKFASDKIFFQYKMAMITLTIMMMATTMIVRIMRGGQWHHIILGTNQNSSPHHIDSPHNRNQSQKRFWWHLWLFFYQYMRWKETYCHWFVFFSSTSPSYIILILLRWGFPSWYAALFNHDSCWYPLIPGLALAPFSWWWWRRSFWF